MAIYKNINFTELTNLDIDNFDLIGVFKLTSSTIITGTIPTGLTFPCIFENYEGFQILRNYDKVYNRQKSGSTWSSWKKLDLNATTFLSLTDTPNTYTGFQGKLLRVNPNETGLEFDNFSYSTYSKMTVGNSFPTSPNHSDLFYNQTNNTLWKYDAISSNWIPIDWQTIIKASPEYQANRLRVNSITGKLEISPDGSSWYECIPAVGNKVIELATLDNANFSYKYWIAPWQIAIIRNANHIPVVCSCDISMVFKGSFFSISLPNNVVGLRPSNTSISNGSSTMTYNNGFSINRLRYTNLSIVPITIGSYMAMYIGDWKDFSIRVSKEASINFFRTIFIGTGYMVESLNTGIGLGEVPSSCYWLGTWYANTGTNLQMNVLTLTRIA
ncbi:MAG: hypothetical protein KatS3mg068_1524 [Candidatus Sericytochromatia bacterium]|nr:MAG: hypothetical protein KatS3mg068_1524 [Candidatus Sericytochromatia bacterium]